MQLDELNDFPFLVMSKGQPDVFQVSDTEEILTHGLRKECGAALELIFEVSAIYEDAP